MELHILLRLLLPHSLTGLLPDSFVCFHLGHWVRPSQQSSHGIVFASDGWLQMCLGMQERAGCGMSSLQSDGCSLESEHKIAGVIDALRVFSGR